MKVHPISSSGLAVFLACCTVFAQTPTPEFEVSSIKPSPSPTSGYFVRCSGGPGTPDPVRFSCENMPLSAYVTMAYGIEFYQLSAPDWMVNARFHISANVPEGTTKEQFRLMLQNLLAARFKLLVHHESRETPKYELVIAKNGPRFKEGIDASRPDDDERSRTVPRLNPDRDGYPALPPGRPGMAWMNDRARLYQPAITMEKFADQIAGQMGKPVTDATGLTGKYEISLYWAADPPLHAGAPADSERDSGPTLRQALEQQLGLRLEAKNGPVDFVVVDRSEKLPTEN